jgi:hypothetical protein
MVWFAYVYLGLAISKTPLGQALVSVQAHVLEVPFEVPMIDKTASQDFQGSYQFLLLLIILKVIRDAIRSEALQTPEDK